MRRSRPNRYQCFRLIFEGVLGFASIPAFMIPLTVAGETVKLEYAGMRYAFLTALSNVTGMFEGVVGAGLFAFFKRPDHGLAARRLPGLVP